MCLFSTQDSDSCLIKETSIGLVVWSVRVIHIVYLQVKEEVEIALGKHMNSMKR